MTTTALLFSREVGAENAQYVIQDGIEAEELGFDQVPDQLVDIQPVFAIYDTWTMLA